MLETIHRPGLEGVIAAQTRLSHVDGQAGELFIAGYPLAEIAPKATFEELLYLLWEDRLPNAEELAIFTADLAERRQLPGIAYEVIAQCAKQQLPVMDVLRIVVGLVGLSVDSADTEASARAVVAIMPTIVAAYWRQLQGQAPIEPDHTLSHTANYLYMLDGQVPDTARTRALETYLNTVSDHGLNASTFTARVIISTQSDIVSAVVGAIGALKGPLHGGAPGPALDMVFEIGTPDRAETVIREKLARGERLMGFGHRVYKVRDPRADVLNGAAEDLFETGDQRALYELVRHVESVALRLLQTHKPDRPLQTNVEFYTALILHGVGLPVALFTPTFAVARVAGWTAHAREHQNGGRILRPLSDYTGEFNREYVPLAMR